MKADGIKCLLYFYIYSYASSVDGEQNVNVYHYTRPLKVKELETAEHSVFRHWGIVVEFPYYDEDEGLPGKYLCEADNFNGKLWASCKRFKKSDEESPGVELKLISAGKIVRTSVNTIKEFCDEWNRGRILYTLLTNNCQDFAKEFAKKIFDLDIDEWTGSDVTSAALVGGSLLLVGGLLAAASLKSGGKNDDK